MKSSPDIVLAALIGMLLTGCAQFGASQTDLVVHAAPSPVDEPEYFLLRPEVEKAYGYSHAVRVGASLIVSGAVSMDEEGNPAAVGDLEQQMKNAYSDLGKVLDHYGYSFDDVIVENVFTTNMAKFLEVAAYRASIYTKHFPTGTWLEVKGLALPEFLIEIELEAHRAK